MSAQPRQLRVIDGHTGEVAAEINDGACPHCLELERDLRAKRTALTRMRNELAQAMGVEPEAAEILEVLAYWRERCMPRAQIVVGGERWLKVRARLREKDVSTNRSCYTVLRLKAAVAGALLSPDHVENGWLDAATIFRDSKTTDGHIARAVTFKRRTGESALDIVDELAGTAIGWLAEHCSCGHTWLEHLRGGPRPDGSQPCSSQDCDCEHFDDFYARANKFMRDEAEKHLRIHGSPPSGERPKKEKEPAQEPVQELPGVSRPDPAQPA